MALDVFAVPIIVVRDAQGLLLTRLPKVPAKLWPVKSVGLDLAVAAAQVLKGAASQAYLGFLKESIAPIAEIPKLRKDEASFPTDQAWRMLRLERREGRKGKQCETLNFKREEPRLFCLLFHGWHLEEGLNLHKYLSRKWMNEWKNEWMNEIIN